MLKSIENMVFHTLSRMLLLVFMNSELSHAQVVQNIDITVDVNCSNDDGGSSCIELDEALCSLESGTTLYLLPGVHTIYNSTILRDLTNISIVGLSEISRSNVVITCSQGQGLSFSNISGLILTNFTISKCELSEEPLAESVDILCENMDLLIGVPFSLKVAIFMALCKDVIVVNVAVTNTSGTGLVGVNILGNSVISNVTFAHNRYTSCFDFPERVAGGAYFVYSDFSHNSMADSFLDKDTTLLVSGSRFEYNSDCSFVALVEANYIYLVTSFEEAFYSAGGGGGGLTVFLAQRDFPVNVSVASCTFYRNTANFGGGAHVGLFSGIHPSNVHFDRCLFDSNQAINLDNGGGGLAVFTGLFNPLFDNSTILSTNVSVFVTESTFLRNTAIKGGGLFTFSLFSGQTSLVNSRFIETFSVLFLVVNCSFIQNSGFYGAGLSSTQRVDYGYNGKVAIVIVNSTIAENTYIGMASNSELASTDSSAFLIESIVAFIMDNFEVRDNDVTGMHILSSVMIVSQGANVTFSRNSGILGGALHLAGMIPVMVPVINSRINFIENSATLRGGAIYVTPRVMSADDILLPINDECFFLPQSAERCNRNEECFDIRALDIRVTFRGNEAPLGSTIYGSTLESCAWAKKLGKFRDSVAPDLQLLQFLAIFFPQVLDINNSLNDSSIVSTVPTKILVNASQVELMPGQLILLTFIVMDDYNNEVPAIVSSLVSSYSDNNSTAVSTVGESGFWFADVNTAEARFSITGSENTVTNVTFFTTDTIATYQLTFVMNSCPLGTLFNASISSCVCDPRLFTHNIPCDDQTFDINIPDKVWIGTAIKSNSSDDLIIAACLTGCEEGSEYFNASDLNAQCSTRLGRAGILCGGCARNLSAVFGSLSCKHCSNLYLLLIPLFGVAGVALFVAIALLGFSIDKGWINIVLFYCNILSLYGNILSSRYNADGIFVPPSLLSLQIGTGLCFYDGMTALAKTGLQFIFPAYLYLLIFIFGLLCRKFSWLSDHFSPTSTFVTLTIMSYVSTLSTCSDIMGGMSLRTLGGYTSNHWQIDPNQTYFNGFHAVLILIAIVLYVVYIIPFPVLLLFPTLLYKYVKKYKPFYDALWAPFRLKCRFWLGVRLIVLLVIFALPRVFDKSYALITIVIFFILIYLQLIIKPYSSLAVNYVDNLLILSLSILLTGAEYKEFYSNNTSSEQAIEYIFLILIVGAGYVTVVVLFFLQLVQKFPFLKSPFRYCNLKRSPKPPPITVTHTEVSFDDIHLPSQTTLYVAINGDSVPQLRESLLEN